MSKNENILWTDQLSKHHFLSVVVPMYNEEELASDLISSVQIALSDYAHPWELIVVDDASQDDTQSVLGRFHDTRIHTVRNPANIERSASRNRGIDLARGRYVCFLDSDDLFETDHLAHLKKRIDASVTRPATSWATSMISIRPPTRLPTRISLRLIAGLSPAWKNWSNPSAIS